MREGGNQGGNYGNRQHQNYNNQRGRANKPFQFRMGQNKFDNVNLGYPPMEQKKYPEFNSDQDIVNYLQSLFTTDNLNKDIYIRNSLSDDGKINILSLENYNGFKNQKVTKEKLLELIPNTTNLEIIEEGENKFIHIKDFTNLLHTLTPLETIKQQRKAMKMQAQQMMFNPQMMPEMMAYPPGFQSFNYYNYQNNFYLTPQMYHMQGYTPMYQQPYPQQGP